MIWKLNISRRPWISELPEMAEDVKELGSKAVFDIRFY
jgi:hypothetical protein|tara:strand:- start:1239 stop:1352 length:114 start_codon:yes stop_codon:yes gene_type:complete